MPSQRKEGKKLIGAYVDESVKDAIRRSGIEEAAALEMYLVWSLINEGVLTKAKVQKMAEEGKLRSATILFLRQHKLLPPAGE